MTRAVLATTIDTAQMRILAYLTAFFLPFTFVAVCQIKISRVWANLVSGIPHDSDVQMARSSGRTGLYQSTSHHLLRRQHCSRGIDGGFHEVLQRGRSPQRGEVDQ